MTDFQSQINSESDSGHERFTYRDAATCRFHQQPTLTRRAMNYRKAGPVDKPVALTTEERHQIQGGDLPYEQIVFTYQKIEPSLLLPAVQKVREAAVRVSG